MSDAFFADNDVFFPEKVMHIFMQMMPFSELSCKMSHIK
tara:strand:- start:9 stop:125 length:117 start_codon:yes stop_codon:yes gene_type:complete